MDDVRLVSHLASCRGLVVIVRVRDLSMCHPRVLWNKFVKLILDPLVIFVGKLD